MPAARESADTVAQCSKCDGNLDTTGNPHWCKACRAKYKRDYDVLVKELTESRGYAAGMSAMRAHLAANFQKLGHSMYSGIEIASTIRNVRGPSGGCDYSTGVKST